MDPESQRHFLLSSWHTLACFRRKNFREEQIPIDPGEKGAPEWPHYTWHAVHLQGQTLCHSSSSEDPYLPPHEDGADDEGWGGFDGSHRNLEDHVKSRWRSSLEARKGSNKNKTVANLPEVSRKTTSGTWYLHHFWLILNRFPQGGTAQVGPYARWSQCQRWRAQPGKNGCHREVCLFLIWWWKWVTIGF